MSFTIKEGLKKLKSSMQPPRDDFVNFYMSNSGYKSIDPPVRASEFSCPFCDEKDFWLYRMNKDSVAWVCGRVCSGSRLPSSSTLNQVTAPLKRSIEWPLFCEMNGLGDLLHEVKFEKIEQEKKKVDHLLKFAVKPSGIVLMQGPTGPGKTYAALGVCEYFTRKNSYVVFCTQKNLHTKWAEKDHEYLHKVYNCNLLVIDDFGTGEISNAFMVFFMDLIDSRLQWSDRGTIITTNLDDQMFLHFCGEALTDRINTGQKFVFKDKSKRKPIQF